MPIFPNSTTTEIAAAIRKEADDLAVSPAIRLRRTRGLADLLDPLTITVSMLHADAVAFAGMGPSARVRAAVCAALAAAAPSAPAPERKLLGLIDGDDDPWWAKDDGTFSCAYSGLGFGKSRAYIEDRYDSTHDSTREVYTGDPEAHRFD